ANMNVPNATTEEEWNAVKRFLRPVMISIVKCKNVLLQGVIFQNSPAWNLHPLMCENIILDDVLARNPSYAQNGDALDLESCKNALIVNSKFDAGDDGICIKSGKDADGRRRGRPCENVVVDGCTVFAESEVITLVGEGKPMDEIAAGIQMAVAKRCFVMSKKAGATDAITLTGGCAKNAGLKQAIERVLKLKVIDLKTDPQLMGALGAAEYARQKGMAKA
ncbi:MAG: hypothetical protein II079_04840, partial [Oscillospiraceae bacterium]|nr:hypothetical protein [Oscillospiraceae bacterium]